MQDGTDFKLEDSGFFRDTLILVFVNENGCVCIYFTELYFFHWFLVVSVVVLIVVRVSGFQSFSEHRLQEILKMPRVSNSFEDYRSIRPSNKKNNQNKFYIMLKRNSFNVHSNTTTARSAKVNCLAKSPRVLRSIVLNIEWVHFVLQNCEILHSARGLYDKNSPS